LAKAEALAKKGHSRKSLAGIQKRRAGLAPTNPYCLVPKFISYKACVKSATAEVNAIVDDEQRKKKIFEYLSSFK